MHVMFVYECACMMYVGMSSTFCLFHFVFLNWGLSIKFWLGLELIM